MTDAVTTLPGWHEMPDLDAETRRLAGERAALETVPVPRRDLDILLAVAAAVLDAGAPAIPFTPQDVEAVVKRYGRA